MADNKSQDGFSPVTIFSIVVQIYVSMSLVLSAAGKPEDHWFRIFVTAYLALMTLLYAGAMLYLMWQRKVAKGRAVGGNPGAQA